MATGSPCGTAGCSGLQGGAALVAIKYTKNPEEVAKVMDYLAREAGREGVLRAHAVPAGAQGRRRRGRPELRQTDDPNVEPALDDVRRRLGARSLPAAAALPPWKWANAYYGALVTRISQVMAGEMTLDEAFARIDQDIADQVAQAAQ